MKVQELLQKISLSSFKQSGNLTLAKVDRADLAQLCLTLTTDFNLPLSSMYATDDRESEQSFKLHVIFSFDHSDEWLELITLLPADDARYPSITALVMAAHWYERYLHDMFGIEPTGHPDLRRLVHHENMPANIFPLRKDFAWNTKTEHANIPFPMLAVEGEGIYQIPVGPIHAGIIEPGHFRFNVAGERIITIEGKLFFTHKGVEKLMEGKTIAAALPFIERLSGDMAAAHALAYSQAVEKIAGVEVSARAKAIRTLLTELERLTMHIHDLANMGGMGTGFSFIAANGFRIKERLMRLSAEICGNRFWRGIIIPGGASQDLNSAQLKSITNIARGAFAEMSEIFDVAFSSEGFLDRLQNTGVLPLEAAQALGAVGLPARASGLDRDARRDHPYASYGEHPVKVIVRKSGDVCARYLARFEELQESIKLIEALANNLPQGALQVDCAPQDGHALGVVESWRGEIICALHLKNGLIDRIFPRDPSFCNWATFGILTPGNIVPDFPLCNKSLNLTYSGNDL